MEKQLPYPLSPTFVVVPPFIYDVQSGVAAIDVSLAG
jgi:hypothetical protein